MAITSWPRVDEDTTDSQYAELFNSIIGTGVRDVGSFLVTADSSGLNVKVAAGFAVVAGSACLSTSSVTLTIGANNGATARTDLIVLRRDFTAAAGQTVRLMVKPGPATADADPTGNFDLVLATVSVPVGAATITPTNVTSARPYISRRIGVWDDTTRPAHRVGTIGWNTSAGRYEYSDGAAWIAGFPPASHTHAWDAITGKPASFPPSSHGHDAADITSGSINEARIPTLGPNKVKYLGDASNGRSYWGTAENPTATGSTYLGLAPASDTTTVSALWLAVDGSTVLSINKDGVLTGGSVPIARVQGLYSQKASPGTTGRSVGDIWVSW